jgi:hypothetical protein
LRAVAQAGQEEVVVQAVLILVAAEAVEDF